VPYLDDASMHQQMVRFAASRIAQGHLPLTSWFPYLGLGSPQFLHYQSLAAMTTGLIGNVVDPDTAFRWSLYLLLVLWPFAIYWCTRLFGLSRWTAASAAAVSPFLFSAAGIGYEATAYVWAGYGVWAQLWAAWTLCLAWGFSYRAMTDRRARVPAAIFIGLTIALHFETGYLALIPLVVWPFLVPSQLLARLRNAVVLAVASVLAAAWVIVPLVSQSHWAAQNELLHGTPLENGYGAGQVMGWLVSGDLFDGGRWPIVTIFMACGLVWCVGRWKSSTAGRALVSIWVVTLLMTFGRTTFGSLYSLLPGSSDIFIRRFQIGVQLSGTVLAGVGVVAGGQLIRTLVLRWRPELRQWMSTRNAGQGLLATTSLLALFVALIPAWTQGDAYAAQNGRNIAYQVAADTEQAPQIGQLISYVRAHPRGRVYAGMPTNWGASFLVGEVPVFKYLESQDIDEVGYTLRTASLMTDPEYFFDQDIPGDYVLFGIGYELMPLSDQPQVPASLVKCAGIYCLWRLPNSGYVHVFDTTGVLTATRANVGTQSESMLQSTLPSENRDLTVAFNGRPAAPVTAPRPATLQGVPGKVLTEADDLAAGHVEATVSTHRTSVVVLSASFDPGWAVTVDQHAATTEMIAPALVGVTVGPGVHRIEFHYVGYGSYDVLWVLSVGSIVVLALGPYVGRRLRRGWSAAGRAKERVQTAS
jgi:hypothetical protein